MGNCTRSRRNINKRSRWDKVQSLISRSEIFRLEKLFREHWCLNITRIKRIHIFPWRGSRLTLPFAALWGTCEMECKLLHFSVPWHSTSDIRMFSAVLDSRCDSIALWFLPAVIFFLIQSSRAFFFHQHYSHAHTHWTIDPRSRHRDTLLQYHPSQHVAHIYVLTSFGKLALKYEWHTPRKIEIIKTFTNP